MGITNYNKGILWGRKQQGTTWLLAANYVHEITNIKIYVDYTKCLSPTPKRMSRSQNYVHERGTKICNFFIFILNNIIVAYSSCLLYPVFQIKQCNLYLIHVDS